jgi:caa(3)-type oxidase subunit IV
MAPQRQDRSFPPETGRLVFLWFALLLLGGIEFGLSFLPLSGLARPLVMLPAIPMIVVVAVGFMNVTKGPAIVRAFAVSALFWLLILLGLGSIDALTRIDYAVTGLH